MKEGDSLDPGTEPFLDRKRIQNKRTRPKEYVRAFAQARSRNTQKFQKECSISFSMTRTISTHGSTANVHPQHPISQFIHTYVALATLITSILIYRATDISTHGPKKCIRVASLCRTSPPHLWHSLRHHLLGCSSATVVAWHSETEHV